LHDVLRFDEHSIKAQRRQMCHHCAG
jgi:hypothetical protein